MSAHRPPEGVLVLADGSLFEGELIGAPLDGRPASGEVVFNTVLSGYQEVITDPSYAGQIVTFTAPHIGNYGVTPHDDEARAPFCRGVIVRDLARRHSNHRATGDLGAALASAGVAGIAGIDTRRLTRVLRDSGALPGAFAADESTARRAAATEPGTAGIDLVSLVTTSQTYTVGSGPRRVVAYDFGIKRTILTCLAEIATVEVVPASTPARDVLARRPDGVFLSNGPGDPSLVAGAAEAIAELVGEVPLFGICLGHQLLSRALGGTTFKLPFGHHGGNHPVLDVLTGKVEITSQNHNFCVDADSLDGVVSVSHRNLNDGTNEGMVVPGRRAFSVQYHPEAGPGPHDSRYLFARFAHLIDQGEL